ncbi:hypothetical protein [Geitlerinema sp. PCC 7407]|uniref:hypothetical protein n=1 Tax=Geitlerinema sp. PCC 7407 TaxID=1173025 RepID=UPI0012371A94|nr:hypothetical protein [Geitlerinema sp. PCC 7407]
MGFRSWGRKRPHGRRRLKAIARCPQLGMSGAAGFGPGPTGCAAARSQTDCLFPRAGASP